MTMSVLDWERSVKTVGKASRNPMLISAPSNDTKIITIDSYFSQSKSEKAVFEDLTKSDLNNIQKEWQEYQNTE
jgi:hypothetical protein